MTSAVPLNVSMDLARRLEAAEARNAVACAEAHQQLHPGRGATVLEVGGGVAIFVGVESPLTHAVGMGMYGSLHVDEIDRLEDFYRQRGAAVNVELCPLADPSLAALLKLRGYGVIESNSALVRALDGASFAPADTVRQAYPDEEFLWARTVGRGFLEKTHLTAEEMDVGSAIWHMQGSRCYLAFAGSHAAAAAALTMDAGLASLFADSTMLGFRGAGLQSRLIRERLRVALEAGCDLATASTLPGSISQRNYERTGFQVAYTKAILMQ